MNLTQKQIDYIRLKLKEYNNISINTGNLKGNKLKEFEKHFIIKKEPFGYYNFKIKTT